MKRKKENYAVGDIHILCMSFFIHKMNKFELLFTCKKGDFMKHKVIIKQVITTEFVVDAVSASEALEVGNPC